MTSTEFYKAGKLKEAIEAQLKDVKANPADHARRLFLFELLAYAGDLDRARRQIDLINYDQMELAAAVKAYQKLLDSEDLRRKFFLDGVPPRFFGEQPEHVHYRIEAVQRMREKKPAETVQLLEMAQKTAPLLHGILNDKPFDSLRDCDDLFGTVLEVFAQGQYYWVPLDHVETLSVSAPKYPRDLLWLPGRLELREGSAGNVFLPTLYPDSHLSEDDQAKLGRLTDWKTTEGGIVRGVGTKLFLAGESDVGLIEWRTLEFEDPKPSEADVAQPATGA